MTPLEIILNLVARVQLPIYARLRNDVLQLREAFYRSARSLLLLLGPVAALLTVASADLLRVVSGETWLAAVPLVRILCWASLLRGLAQLFPQVYEVSAHPRFALYDTLLSGTMLVGGFALALWLAPPTLGALAVAWVWLLTYPPVLVAHFLMVRWCAPITPRGVARSLGLPALGVLMMLFVLMLANRVLPVVHSPWLGLTLVVSVGLGTYAIYLRRVLHLTRSELLPQRPAAG